MFIDILTTDSFKRSVNSLYFKKLDLIAIEKKELQVGTGGHLVTVMDDEFLDQFISGKNNPLKPDKVVGNFLVFSSKLVTIKSMAADKGCECHFYSLVVGDNLAAVKFNAMEYKSVWWLIPEGQSL